MRTNEKWQDAHADCFVARKEMTAMLGVIKMTLARMALARLFATARDIHPA